MIQKILDSHAEIGEFKSIGPENIHKTQIIQHITFLGTKMNYAHKNRNIPTTT